MTRDELSRALYPADDLGEKLEIVDRYVAERERELLVAIRQYVELALEMKREQAEVLFPSVDDVLAEFKRREGK